MTNTGATVLSNVVVTDAVARGCEITIPTLAVGAAQHTICTQPNVTARVDNTVDVIATTPYAEFVRASDTATILAGPTPVSNVSIDKKVWDATTATWAETSELTTGSTARWQITVSNTGAAALTEVTVVDPNAPDCAHAVGGLAVGGVTSWECTLDNVTADLVNTVTVTATDIYAGAPGTLTASDTASVTVVPVVVVPRPSITLYTESCDTDKFACSRSAVLGEDGWKALTIATEKVGSWRVTAVNDGNVTLFDVNVTNDIAAACEFSTPQLVAGESMNAVCDAPDLTTGSNRIVNASVSAHDEFNTPVSAEAKAEFIVADQVPTPAQPGSPADSSENTFAHTGSSIGAGIVGAVALLALAGSLIIVRRRRAAKADTGE